MPDRERRRLLRGLRAIAGLAALGLAACTPAAGPAPALGPSPGAAATVAPLHYILRYTTSEGGRALEITLELTGDASGTTTIVLPSAWAGQSRFYDGIDRLAVSSPSPVTVAVGTSAARRTLTHAPGAPLTVRYRVREPRGRELATSDRRFWPFLAPEYFHFIGHAVLVTPASRESAPRPITLDWPDLPPGWALANSFGVGARRQDFSQSLGALRHAVFTAGDFRVAAADVRGRPVHVAIRGEWKFSDSEFSTLVQQILSAEREFWNDDDFPFYLVTLIPLGTKCCTYGGSGFTNSFAMTVASDHGIDAHMTHLLAHETFHAWNGQRIRRAAPEELLYWFSEGFTNYYARVLSLRAGLLDLKGYVDDYNDVIFHYATSPVRNATNDAARAAFWKDEFGHRLPYERGDLLAHAWNAQIRGKSQGRASLDGFMRDLLEAARLRSAVVSAGSVDELIKPYLPEGVGGDIARHAERGETIEPRPDALGPCVTLAQRARDTFDLGFDRGSLETRVVAGVKPDGPAHRAGVRDGQRLTYFGVQWNDPATPVRLRVKDVRGERELAFLPRGAAAVVPTYVLDEQAYARDPGRCLEWFGLKR